MSTKDFLLQLGIAPDLLGYYYLTELINRRREIIKDPKQIASYSSMSEYKIVAESYDTGASAVERCCRHAIHHICKTPNEFINELCKGNLFNRTRPTNTGFICAVAEYLNNKGE